MQFHTKRETQYIPCSHVFIRGTTDGVKITGTQLVKRRDSTKGGMRPQIESNSLPGKDMKAYTGRKFIIVIRVFLRFLHPEIIG